MAKEVLQKREAHIEYTSSTRWIHWLRFFSIIALSVTGFYIAYVFVSPETSSEPTLFFNAKVRMWHEIIGFALVGMTIFKTYLFFFNKDRVERLEMVSYKDAISPKVWLEQIKYYLFIGPHPQLRGVYNPLQFVAYVFLYAILVVLCVTGLVLYVHVYHEGLGGFIEPPMRYLEAFMGGLANVRLIHHIAMWAIFIFVPVHIYMVVFNSIRGREGSVDSVISGLKFKKTH